MRKVGAGLQTVGIVSLLLLLTAASAAPQSATASLSGHLTGESGAAVVGATVTVRQPETGASRSLRSDARGNFSFSNLEPGEYELQAELEGFRTAVRTEVVLTVGSAVSVELQMSLGAVSEELTVVYEEPLIEASKPELSRVVGREEIESLPNIGRNFVDFVKLSSGVAPGRENIGGGAFKEPDTGVGASAAPRLSFGGQSELNSLIQVDGADNVQTFTGLPRATPSQEAVQEFRVLNSTYLAEYGRALGGFVNIVTRSGTNDLQGSVYDFAINDALNASSLLSRPGTDVLRQQQYGATLGGPLARDRSFYFLNYEGQRRSESNGFSEVITDNLAAINEVRSRFGLSLETDDQVRSSDYDQLFLKLNHRPGKRHSLSLRYNFLDSEALNFPGGGGRGSPASSTARNNQTEDQAVVASAVSILSPRLINEARGQWAKRDFDFQPLRREPALEISNLILMGKTTSDMDLYAETRLQLSNDLLVQSGAHQTKLGFDFNDLTDDAGWDLFFPARIIFPNLTSFLEFSPVVFWWPTLKDGEAHPGFSTVWDDAVPGVWDAQTLFRIDHTILGAFVQDSWRATQKLTLNFGLRYDVEKYPSRYIRERDTDNFQPRLGVAYAYSPRGVIRGGWGLFTDRLASSVGQIFGAAEWLSRGDLANAQLLFPGVAPVRGRFQQNVIVGPGATAAAVEFLTTGRVPGPNPFGFADNLSAKLTNPYSQQASAQLSQEVGRGIALSVSYLYLEAKDLPGTGPNLNATETGTLPSGKPIVGGRRFPELGDFFVIDNFVESTYRGATFEARKRLRSGLGFHLAYTVSRTRSNGDSVSNLADFPEGLDVGREEARSRQHVGERLTLSLLSRVPSAVPFLGDLELAVLGSYESGRYFTVFAGRDANRDGNPNSDRPGLLERNSLQGPAFASVDLRIARELGLPGEATAELSVDVFNLLNRDNIKDLNTNYGGTDLDVPPNPLLGFNTPRAVFNPRQLQLGLKIRF